MRKKPPTTTTTAKKRRKTTFVHPIGKKYCGKKREKVVGVFFPLVISVFNVFNEVSTTAGGRSICSSYDIAGDQ